MQKLAVFNNVTVDGFICSPTGDMSWAHKAIDDAEWTDWVNGNTQGDGALMFGRVTYDMMAGWWPSPMAAQMMPVVAAKMNASRKIVFSRTLDSAAWNNTTVVKDDILAAVQKLKAEPGDGITILGSASIVSQLAEAGLIDTYQFVVTPIAIGQGKSMFASVTHPVPLALTESRNFKNGNLVLTYEPVR